MRVEIQMPFSYSGKKLAKGEEVTMSAHAFALYSKLGYVKEVKAAPTKSGKDK